ncbi:MAG: Crp/Fnr family transcriptional regulator [Bacteroidia bacterium]|jgi:CRP-like cAMP-binding protein|nr:Crp/Fnr family transcriptional regulator [Bacteroidia bacterium]
MTSYLEKIASYIKSIDSETLTELQRISSEKKYKKGDLLLRQNEICEKSYLLLSGIARKYYLNDGKEITTELYFENDLAVSFESYTLQQPGREFIEALTDITVSITHYQAFQDAKTKYPKLVTLDLMLAEYYGMWVEHRLFQFHTMTATERYLDILTKSPHIVQAVPLTIIASYLGISLETLSRIRARI